VTSRSGFAGGRIPAALLDVVRKRLRDTGTGRNPTHDQTLIELAEQMELDDRDPLGDFDAGRLAPDDPLAPETDAAIPKEPVR